MANRFSKYAAPAGAPVAGGNRFAKYAAPSTSTPEEEPGRGLSGVVSDLWSSYAGGANALLKIGGDLYGLTTGDFDNWASNQGQRGQDFWSKRKTPQLLQLEQQRKAKIDAVDSEWKKAAVAFWETAKSPSLGASFLFEQMPMLAPVMGIGRGAGIAARGLGAGVKGAESAALGAAVGTGATMQGADAGSQAREQLMSLPDDVWLADPDVADRVRGGESLEEVKEDQATRLSRNAATASLITSVGLNMLPGARHLEKALAGIKIPSGRLSGMVKGYLGESAQEGLEEASGAFFANLATREVDPTQSAVEGIGEAGGLGAFAGVFGAVAGATADPVEVRQVDRIASAETVDEAVDAAMEAVGEPAVAVDPVEGIIPRVDLDLDGSPIEPAPFRPRLTTLPEADLAFGQREAQQQVQREQDFDRALEQRTEQQLQAAARETRWQEQRRRYSPDNAPPNPAMRDALLKAMADRLEVVNRQLSADEQQAQELASTIKESRYKAADGSIIEQYGSEAGGFTRFQKQPGADYDDMVTSLARAGGISMEDARAQGLMDKNVRRGMQWVFTRRGMTLDEAGEHLVQQGWFTERPDANTVLSMLDDTLRGTKKHYSPQGQEYQAFLEAKERALMSDEEVEDLYEPAYYEPDQTPDEKSLTDLVVESLRAGVSPETIGRLGDIFSDDAAGFAQALRQERADASENARWATVPQGRGAAVGNENPAGAGAAETEIPGFGAQDARPDEQKQQDLKDFLGEAMYAELYDAPALTLEPQTEDSLRAQAQQQEKARQQQNEQARKAEADEQRNSFTLTGSDSAVDQAEARGQSNLFDAPTSASSPSTEAAKPEAATNIPENIPPAKPKPAKPPEKPRAPREPAPAPTPAPSPEIRLRSNGQPFASEKGARASAQFRESPNPTVVPVEGGFGIQPGEDPGTPLNAITLTEMYEVEGTDQKVMVSMTAQEALADIDSRIDGVKKLIACLRS